MRAIGLTIVLLVAAAAAGCDMFAPALPAGMKACINVPQAICDDILSGRVNDRAPVALTAYRITCTSASCTEKGGGQAEAQLTWADGKSETFTSGWGGFIEEPLPVAT